MILEFLNNSFISNRSLLSDTFLLLSTFILAIPLRYVIVFVAKQILSKTHLMETVYKHMKHKKPIYLLLVITLMMALFPLTDFSDSVTRIMRKVLNISFIASISWVVVTVIYVFEDYLFHKFTVEHEDNNKNRKIRTQVKVLKKILVLGVLFVSSTAILINFTSVRTFGENLLASAGVLGVVVGFASQKFLSNLIAGFQIALTQPIKLDDAVIAEGEWGWVEEITLTYVIVKLWDKRRLVLPITYFVEKPFQNWTRGSSDIIGSVFIHVDYSVPVGILRKELNNIVRKSPLWDGKVAVLQVTECTDKAIEVRILVSAKDSPRAFDLRCFVREEMIKYINENFKDGLPKYRTELSKDYKASHMNNIKYDQEQLELVN